jgi:membrane protein
MSKRISSLLTTCLIAAKRFYREQHTYRAAALAFTTLLSLVPLFTVFVYLTTLFPIFNDIIKHAEKYIIMNFFPPSRGIIIEYLTKFTINATQVPTFGIVFLFVTAYLLFYTVVNSINDIWHKTKSNDSTRLIIIKAMIVLITPFLIGLSEIVSSFLHFLFNYSDTIHHVSFIIPIFINSFIFAIFFYTTATTQVECKHALLGGFITAILFEISKLGFAFYLHQFPSYEYIYGTLSAIPIFLIWLYVSWVIVLYGAIIVNLQYKTR